MSAPSSVCGDAISRSLSEAGGAVTSRSLSEDGGAVTSRSLSEAGGAARVETGDASRDLRGERVSTRFARSTSDESDRVSTRSARSTNDEGGRSTSEKGARSTSAGGDDVALGWTGRVMQWLRVITALVIVNVMFLLGTLAGLVLLGIMPAAVAATSVLRRNDLILGTAEEGLIRTFWSQYRAEFWRANRAGIPFWIVGALLAADLAVLPQLTGPVSAVLLVFTVALLLAAVVTLLTAIALLSRYDDGILAVLRYALVLPPTSLVMTVGVLVAVTGWALIVSVAPVLLPLVGATIPLAIAVRLIDARLDRIEAAG